MGYYDTTRHYRDELKRCIKAKDTYGAKLNCKAYIKVLELLYTKVDSISKKLYVRQLQTDFEALLKLMESEGITARVAAINLEQDRLVIPPVAATPSSQTTTGGKATLTNSSRVTAPPTNSPISSLIGDLPPKTPDTPPPQNVPKNELPLTGSVANSSAISDNEEWIADIFEQYLPATVAVYTPTGEGTGFFISKNGYLLTNHHVVYEGNVCEDSIWIKTGDEKKYYDVKVIVADSKLDIALLKINENKVVPYIPIIENYDDVRIGSNMLLIGNGLGFGLAPITGTIKFTHHVSSKNLVYTAPSNSGDSGSPVINRNGLCIGIHKSRAGEPMSRGIAYATPADAISPKLEEWKKKYNFTFQY